MAFLRWLLSCTACEAREGEIRRLHLELERVHGHLDRSQARMAEIAKPGMVRAVPVPRPYLTEQHGPEKPPTAGAVVEALEKRAQARGEDKEAPWPGYDEVEEPTDRYELES